MRRWFLNRTPKTQATKENINWTSSKLSPEKVSLCVLKDIIKKVKGQPTEWKKILGWPKSSFGFFHKMLLENPNKLFGQPKIYKSFI